MAILLVSNKAEMKITLGYFKNTCLNECFTKLLNILLETVFCPDQQFPILGSHTPSEGGRGYVPPICVRRAGADVGCVLRLGAAHTACVGLHGGERLDGEA